VKLALDGVEPSRMIGKLLNFTRGISDEWLRYPDSYEKCVLRAANTNGDSDSIACIAGAISGAYLGVNAIPANWVERIERSEYLIDLSDRLAEAGGNA